MKKLVDSAWFTVNVIAHTLFETTESDNEVRIIVNCNTQTRKIIPNWQSIV